MLTIRAETPDDIAGIHDVVTLAFGRDNEARLIAALRASPDFVSALSLVAVESVDTRAPTLRQAPPELARKAQGERKTNHDDNPSTAQAELVEAGFARLSTLSMEEGRVVGHILFSRIAIRTTQRAVPALALAPLAVRPDQQNCGVGSALVRHGVAACRQQGHAIVVVLGHAQYYPRFGFITARSKGVEPPWPVNDAAFMVQELIPGALDGVRGVVEYPPALATV